ncbi:MAG: UDP-N-acetylmuramoyl-L-alanyl-D-glutamate--2,6-diaminopimelate ligase [Lachnospiraceae bacterium]|nr:UDP-N-acetylmuramoyl-L-alanyl-D-glutamate--2,6-diaminopimelate ligase [Lachnospiraceae bacterium]
MRLSEILENERYELTAGNTGRKLIAGDIEIASLCNDTRQVEEGCLFFCIKGANFDSHDAAGEAAAKGAGAIVIERDVEMPGDLETPLVRVADTRAAMAKMAAAFYGHPAEKLRTIGITGTKGKTTTTYLIRQMLENAGYKTGLIGTIEMIIGDTHIPAGNTTPESILLQKTMRRMVDEDCVAVVMEVSSQALMLHRTDGFVFDVGVFTNIEEDHIGPNEHRDFADYLHCKSMLFRQCRFGIGNMDDEHFEEVMKDRTCELITYGFKKGADYRAADPMLIKKSGELGVLFSISGKLDMRAEFAMPGNFSVYNALCAIAVAKHFDCDDLQIEDALKHVSVRGRIEMIPVSPEYTLLIDYAHNAMALENLLVTLKEYRPNRLVTLFGCGGNRSKVRRYQMGEVSGKLSDLTVITSDNPRFEDPMAIIGDIREGIEKTTGSFVEIPDRREAIKYCIKNAEPGDVIVLAGKGHEDYQEIKGVKYPMDERDLIRDVVAELAEEASGNQG